MPRVERISLRHHCSHRFIVPVEKNDRPVLLAGHKVGLALMRKEDVETFARWNQDLAFTALIGTPGELHSLEMRQEFFEKHARPRADSIEFGVVLLGNGQLVGFGGLSDISRALTASLFVGIGERSQWGQGLGTEATRLICNTASSFAIFTASRWRLTVTTAGRFASMSTWALSASATCAAQSCSTACVMTR